MGAFDIIYDPTGREQIAAGRVTQRDNRAYFDTWTSFTARSFRGNPPPQREDFELSNYRIQATLNADLSLDCVTRVTLQPRVDGATAVSFEMAPEMSVASATVDGQPAEVLQRESVRANIGSSDNQFFVVFPPQPRRAGRTYQFQIHDSGKVVLDAGSHVYYVTARGNWYPTYNSAFRAIRHRIPLSQRSRSGGCRRRCGRPHRG